MKTVNGQEANIEVVGSSTFGRYPKISVEKTYNMFISDEWLVNYAGYQKILDLSSEEGRGFFHSTRGNLAVAVVGDNVYKLNSGLSATLVGTLETSSGEVFIDENLSRQICIVDGLNAYIYNYDAFSFTKQSLPFSPGYVSYHNTFFLLASTFSDTNPQNWYAYEFATNSTIQLNSTFALESKPDTALAVVRIPGGGNNVLVLGSIVSEVWLNVGGDQNYRRNQSFNIDYGVVSNATIGTSDTFVCWIAKNEKNAPALMVARGGSIERISTDGIDFLLQNIQRPDKSTAFFYRQDGHLFYQFTFFDQQDNLSLVYDFNTQKFFHVTDEDQNYHPARQVIFFNENSYFVSLNDGGIYEIGSKFVYYNYSVDDDTGIEYIPRLRVCNTVRKRNTERFRATRFMFWIEQGVNDFFLLNFGVEDCDGLLITEVGEDPIVTEDGFRMLTENGVCITNLERPRVDMTISKNGNQSFSNVVSRYLNPQGKYRNQITWDRLGQANEFTIQLRFWGLQRFVCGPGIMEMQ